MKFKVFTALLLTLIPLSPSVYAAQYEQYVETAKKQLPTINFMLDGTLVAGGTVSTINEINTALGGSSLTTQARAYSVRQAVNGLTNTPAVIPGTNDIATSLNTINTSLGAFPTTTGLKGKIGSLNSGLGAAEDIYTNVTAINTAIGGSGSIEARITAVNHELDSLANTSLTSTIAAISQKLDGDNTNTIQNSINHIDTALGGPTAANIKAKVTAINTSLDSSTSSSVTDAVANIRQNLDNTNPATTNIAAAVTSVKAKLGSVEGDISIGTSGTQRADIDANITNLRQTLNGKGALDIVVTGTDDIGASLTKITTKLGGTATNIYQKTVAIQDIVGGTSVDINTNTSTVRNKLNGKIAGNAVIDGTDDITASVNTISRNLGSFSTTTGLEGKIGGLNAKLGTVGNPASDTTTYGLTDYIYTTQLANYIGNNIQTKVTAVVTAATSGNTTISGLTSSPLTGAAIQPAISNINTKLGGTATDIDAKITALNSALDTTSSDTNARITRIKNILGGIGPNSGYGYGYGYGYSCNNSLDIYTQIINLLARIRNLAGRQDLTFLTWLNSNNC